MLFRSPDEAELLHRLQHEGVTLAVHGYDHRTRQARSRRRSELSGLTEHELSDRLARADAVFSGYGITPPRAFVPPFNSFDSAQWDVLAARFAVICGGPESVSQMGFLRPPAWYRNALWVPSYAPLYGTAAQVFRWLSSVAAPGLWLPVVLHWGWEDDSTLADLQRLAALLGKWAVSWETLLAVAEPLRCGSSRS